MNKRNLGAAVSAVNNALYPDIDYVIAGWGDCTGLVASAEERELDRVARQHGFRDRHHLKDVVARATSDRWVFFHLGW